MTEFTPPPGTEPGAGAEAAGSTGSGELRDTAGGPHPAGSDLSAARSREGGGGASGEGGAAAVLEARVRDHEGSAGEDRGTLF